MKRGDDLMLWWIGWFAGACIAAGVVAVIPGDQGFGVGLLFGLGCTILDALIGKAAA